MALSATMAADSEELCGPEASRPRRRMQSSPSQSGAMLLTFDDLTEFVEEERAEAAGGANNPRLSARAGGAAPSVPPRARRYAVRELAGYEAPDAPDPA
ncbi:MAG: hypothetical protein HFJ74_07945, partial [Eggerthellaceae bacterium]|nr:hypothetical protein [Eggerthellaceae bacterium]